MTDTLGLYLHIPFCRKKCAYCDFYSAVTTEAKIDEYVTALSAEIKRWSKKVKKPIDTVYIGGGTPSVLGERIEAVVQTVRNCFSVLPDAEITVEMNPSDDADEFLSAAARSGVNRLSVGLQSGNDAELLTLGRTHTVEAAQKTVALARALGFKNISLDLMLGLPESGLQTLDKSIDFALSLQPEHLSAYLLKIEQGTKFYACRSSLALPDGDAQAEQYLHLCDRLQQNGYRHYEISNFAKFGFESRHNTKYWTLAPYLGIGPSAHSFLNGMRFYYPRDLKAFLTRPDIVNDDLGGDEIERIMLALRLADGVDLSEYRAVTPFLNQLTESGLGVLQDGNFALTDRGMLVSNQIIAEILERL
ncbi:MAG: radical SAM family heme chaperone HemW [Clostridia bacterium]|nr:radical SAM family heme chaperone HemW [Clostridia bacterium]